MGVHPAPGERLHLRESGNRKAIVERVDLRGTPIRIVYMQKPQHGNKFVTLRPDYLSDSEAAIERANRWVGE